MEVAARDREVRERCSAVLRTLTPTAPVTLWDVQTIWEMLRPIVQRPYALDAYFVDSVAAGRDEIRVSVCRAGDTVYECVLTAERAGA